MEARKIRIVMAWCLVTGVVMSLDSNFLVVETSGWSLDNQEVGPGNPRDISFNNMLIHLKSNVSAVVNLDVDNGMRNMEVHVTIVAAGPVMVNISIQKESIERNLKHGQEIIIPGTGKRFRFTSDLLIGMTSNTSSTRFNLGYNVNMYGGNKSALRWIGQSIDEAPEDGWTVQETTISDGLVQVEQVDAGYYALVEEIAPGGFPSWLVPVVVIVVLGVLAISIIVISKREYLRSAFLRISGQHVPIHRMSFEEVIKNDTREKILDLVIANPGIHFNELSRRLGLEAGALNWHLDVLLDYKLLKKENIGQYVAFFPRITLKHEFPLYVEATKLMKNATALEILKMLDERGPMFQAELASVLGVDKKTIRYHGKRLEKEGLIEFKIEDGKKYHVITGKGRDVLETIESLGENGNLDE